MPEGIEDNYVDEMFLKGLVHKSIFIFIVFAIANILDSFPDLHYPSMVRETLEIIHVVNTLVHFLVTYSLIISLGQLQVPDEGKL